MAVFKNPNDPENINLISTLELLIREIIVPNNPEEIKITEIDCADPGCVDKATKIEVIESDSTTVVYMLHKPLVFVKKSDLENALKNYGK